MDDIYVPSDTTRKLDKLVAAGFKDVKYEVNACSRSKIEF